MANPQKYLGYDFRGNQLKPENLAQYLLDFATYQKALRDFGIGVRVGDVQDLRVWSNFDSIKKENISNISNKFVQNAGQSSAKLISKDATGKGTVTVIGDVNGLFNYLKDAGLIGITGTVRDGGKLIPSLEGMVSTIINQSKLGTSRGELFYSANNPKELYLIPRAGVNTMVDARMEYLERENKSFSKYNPNSFIYDPQKMYEEMVNNPNLLSSTWDFLGNWASSAAAKEESKNIGGLGVVAKGLSTAGQFAGLAGGLYGALSGLSALQGGTGGLLSNLGAAAKAGMSANASFPSLADIISKYVSLGSISPSIAEAGLGALSAADQGLGRSILGGVSGYIGGPTGSLVNAIGSQFIPATGQPSAPQLPAPSPGAFDVSGLQTTPIATSPIASSIVSSPVGLPGTGLSPSLYDSAIQGLLGSPYGSAPQFGNYQDAMIGLANSLAYQPKLFDTIGGIGINVPGLQPWSQTA